MTSLIIYREKALTDEEFVRLDQLADENLQIKTKYMKVIKTRIDEYGDTVEYTDYADSGYDIVTRDNFSFKLIESLQRPTLARNIAKHLHRLQAHKRYARDSASWQIIVEDICNDLADVSEYAIIKICEKFRLNTTTSFFPDTAKLIKEIKDLDYSLKNIYFKEQSKQRDNQEQFETRKKTFKSKKRVKLLIKIGMKKQENMTKWEIKWINAIKKTKTAEIIE